MLSTGLEEDRNCLSTEQQEPQQQQETQQHHEQQQESNQSNDPGLLNSNILVPPLFLNDHTGEMNDQNVPQLSQVERTNELQTPVAQVQYSELASVARSDEESQEVFQNENLNTFDPQLLPCLPIIINMAMSPAEKLVLNKGKLKLEYQYSELSYGVVYFYDLEGKQGKEREEYYKQQLHRYEGTFKNKKIFGQGIYFYPSGSIYMGEVSEKGRQGMGVYYFQNGNIFQGQWQANQQSGLGKFLFLASNSSRLSKTIDQANQSTTASTTAGIIPQILAKDKRTKVIQFYNGYFKHAQYDGFGCYSYRTRYYIGFWKGDKCHGAGRLCSFDGTIIKEGLFENDVFIQPGLDIKKQFPPHWTDFLPSFIKEENLLDNLLTRKPIL